eukprot:7556_1
MIRPPMQQNNPVRANAQNNPVRPNARNNPDFRMHYFATHPQMQVSHDVRIQMVEVHAHTNRGITICNDTERKIRHHRNSSISVFNAFITLIIFLKDFIPKLKSAYELWAAQRLPRVMGVSWKEFACPFLYANNILKISVTHFMWSYTTLGRYLKIQVPLVEELWGLTGAAILPCDRFVGPFISKITQLYSANELVKMIVKHPAYDSNKTMRRNFIAKRCLNYYYANDLPFHYIIVNKYDRKLFFEANARDIANQGGVAQFDSRQDIEKKRSRSLKDRNAIRYEQMIERKEHQIEKLERQIERKDITIGYLQYLLDNNGIVY